MEQTRPNPDLYNAIKDRGTAYLMVFRELKSRYGEEAAQDVMRSASRAHGLAIGRSLAKTHLVTSRVWRKDLPSPLTMARFSARIS